MKKEQRSLKDSASARRLKDKGTGQRGKQRTHDQKALEKVLWQQRKDQGQAGLAGSGRSGKQPGRKEKQRRKEEKHKGKGHYASLLSRVAHNVAIEWLSKD